MINTNREIKYKYKEVEYIITYVKYILKHKNQISGKKDKSYDKNSNEYQTFKNNYEDHIKKIKDNFQDYIENLVPSIKEERSLIGLVNAPHFSRIKNQYGEKFTFSDNLYNQMLNNPNIEEVANLIEAIHGIKYMFENDLIDLQGDIFRFFTEIAQLNRRLKNYAQDKEKIQGTELGVEYLIEEGEDFGKEEGEDFGKEKEIKPDPEKIELSRKITEEPGQKNFMNKISQASSALFNVISRCLKLLLTLIKNKLMSGVDKFTKLFGKKEEKIDPQR